MPVKGASATPSPSLPLSRRQFVQVSGLGLLAPFGPSVLRALGEPVAWQARVAYSWVIERSEPSVAAKEVARHKRDAILPVLQVVLADDPSYNRVWYKIGEAGYIHSGGLQPVRTQFNMPMRSMPEGGMLVELTVPFSDVRGRPDTSSEVQARYYYSTTYWAVELATGPGGEPWYRLEDDRTGLSYWARAEHLRPVAAEEVVPLSPNVDPRDKRIEVNLGRQWVIAYEGDYPVFMSRASTGFVTKDGESLTPPGKWSTFYKRPSRHMAAGDPASAEGYNLPGVPWVSYFTTTGVSFHGTYWHNDYGRPRSHGCVNLPPQAAKWLYRWTMPPVPPGERLVREPSGTRVIVT